MGQADQQGQQELQDRLVPRGQVVQLVQVGHRVHKEQQALLAHQGHQDLPAPREQLVVQGLQDLQVLVLQEPLDHQGLQVQQEAQVLQVQPDHQGLRDPLVRVVLQVQQDHRGQLGRQEVQELPVLVVLLVPVGHQDLKGILVARGQVDHQDRRVPQVAQAPRVPVAQPEIRVLQVLPVHQDLRDLQDLRERQEVPVRRDLVDLRGLLAELVPVDHLDHLDQVDQVAQEQKV